jgi:hypothetical protein
MKLIYERCRRTIAPFFVIALIFVLTQQLHEPKAQQLIEHSHIANTQTKPSKKKSKVVYACPMHPDVTSTKPGRRCPKCRMELKPVDPTATPSPTPSPTPGD